jgi:hypothetical protein
MLESNPPTLSVCFPIAVVPAVDGAQLVGLDASLAVGPAIFQMAGVDLLEVSRSYQQALQKAGFQQLVLVELLAAVVVDHRRRVAGDHGEVLASGLVLLLRARRRRAEKRKEAYQSQYSIRRLRRRPPRSPDQRRAVGVITAFYPLRVFVVPAGKHHK